MPLAVWLVLCLIWGSTWLFIKLGLADLPPVGFAAVRFVIASAVLWGIVGSGNLRCRREPARGRFSP